MSCRSDHQNIGAELVRNFLPKSTLRARIRTKRSAAGAKLRPRSRTHLVPTLRGCILKDHDCTWKRNVALFPGDPVMDPRREPRVAQRASTAGFDVGDPDAGEAVDAFSAAAGCCCCAAALLEAPAYPSPQAPARPSTPGLSRMDAHPHAQQACTATTQPQPTPGLTGPGEGQRSGLKHPRAATRRPKAPSTERRRRVRYHQSTPALLNRQRNRNMQCPRARGWHARRTPPQ